MKIIKIKKLNKSEVSGFIHILRQSKVSGFTLVEALVALSVFTISLLIMIWLSADNIINLNYAKNKLTATYLAVDGIEYMRNRRDSCIFFTTDCSTWTGYKTKIFEKCKDQSCYFDSSLDYTSDDFSTILVCENNICNNFRTDGDGIYNYDNGNLSRFKRDVSVEEIEEYPDQIKIISTVYWTTYNNTHSVSFTDYLRNWAEPEPAQP